MAKKVTGVEEVCLLTSEGALQGTRSQGSWLKERSCLIPTPQTTGVPHTLSGSLSSLVQTSASLVNALETRRPVTWELIVDLWNNSPDSCILMSSLAWKSTSLLLPLQCDKPHPRKRFRWWLLLLLWILGLIQFWGDFSKMSLVRWWRGYHQGTWDRAL